MLRWSAERRPRSPKGNAATARLVRRSVLHPLGFRGESEVPRKWGKGYGLPGAAKNTGSGALALFFTSPWRGEVDSRSEATAGGRG